MTEKISCFVIDDEYLAQDILEKYIKKVSFLELKGTFSSPLTALEKIKEDRPDLLFLDIDMPDLDGLSFIKILNPKPIIILTTAYDEFALRAYDLEVKDYLLKPVSFERFYKGVFRVYQELSLPQNNVESDFINNSNLQTNSIFVKSGQRLQRINMNDIIFIEGQKDYLQIHTTAQKIMTLMSFNELLEILPAKNFQRVHRSYVVAMDKIEYVEKKHIRVGKVSIPISNTYSETFFDRLKDHNL